MNATPEKAAVDRHRAGTADGAQQDRAWARCSRCSGFRTPAFRNCRASSARRRSVTPHDAMHVPHDGSGAGDMYLQSSCARGASGHPARLFHARRRRFDRRLYKPQWRHRFRTMSRKTSPTNRARMAAALGCEPERLLTAYQIHSPNVVVAETPWSHARAPARRRDRHARTRVLRSAFPPRIAARSCLPMRDAAVIGAAHAGWRGALTGVIEAHHRGDGNISARGARG